MGDSKTFTCRMKCSTKCWANITYCGMEELAISGWMIFGMTAICRPCALVVSAGERRNVEVARDIIAAKDKRIKELERMCGPSLSTGYPTTCKSFDCLWPLDDFDIRFGGSEYCFSCRLKQFEIRVWNMAGSLFGGAIGDYVWEKIKPFIHAIREASFNPEGVPITSNHQPPKPEETAYLFTKRHHDAIIEVLHIALESASQKGLDDIGSLKENLRIMFANDNPEFDRNKFDDA